MPVNTGYPAFRSAANDITHQRATNAAPLGFCVGKKVLHITGRRDHDRVGVKSVMRKSDNFRSLQYEQAENVLAGVKETSPGGQCNR